MHPSKHSAKSISDAVTKFAFKCPSYMIDSISIAGTLKYDSDDDLDVDRDREEILLIGKINEKLIIAYCYTRIN